DDHLIWDRVYKQTDAINWMLSYTKGGTTTSPTPTPSTNAAPVVSAGSDLNVTLPVSDVYIQGTASDSDGSIASYKWSKIAGGSVGMTNTGGARLRVYNVLAGSYTFRLSVTDDKGATKYDDVNLTVSATINKAPVANAGTDKTTTSTSITLTGSGTDSDGKIVSYKWAKSAGGTATITNASAATVTVSGMSSGTYTLKLTVTDDKGATGVDYVNITMSGTSTGTTNIVPIANAGPDKVISTRSITLYGSGTDKDGRIVSYKWEKYYGPAVTLTNANTATVTLSGMVDGKYFLRLTVTDDKGATDYDNMNVIVDGGTARIYTPSLDTEEVADYTFAPEGTNIVPDNITITDFRILQNQKRSMRELDNEDQTSSVKDES
ncbi:MAG TPA: PKD domain-containing protein, partial [Chryseosolibacter sp.]|nr:PKD domain-containing protein [Chryseosolibacter sp.]